MSSKLSRSQSELPLTGSKPGKRRLLFKYTVYLAALALTLFVIYQLFFIVQITAGVSNVKSAPEQVATIEIINASGIAQIGRQVTEKLEATGQDEIEIIVVKAERLEYKIIAKSLIISRDKNTKLAEFVARTLGFNESEIVFRRAGQNDMSPSVTLVLGEDIQKLLDPEEPNKES